MNSVLEEAGRKDEKDRDRTLKWADIQIFYIKEFLFKKNTLSFMKVCTKTIIKP